MSRRPKEGWTIVNEVKARAQPMREAELPIFTNMASLLDSFDEEVTEVFSANEDLGVFYMPFLGFISAVTDITAQKIDETIPMVLHPWKPPKGLEQFNQNLPKVHWQHGTKGRRKASKLAELQKLYSAQEWFQRLDEELGELISDYYPKFEFGLAGRKVDELDLEEVVGLLNWIYTHYSSSSVLEWFTQNLNGFYHEQSQWFIETFILIAQWLEMALKPEYRHDGFVYITQDDVPQQIPKMYRRSKIPGPTWVSGFGNRLIVPNLHALTSAQKAEMWDYLLVKQNIYDNEKIDHSVRSEAFSLIANQIPKRAKTHLDLCAGRGDFAQFLADQKQIEPTCLLDIAPHALLQAKESGFEAVVANADLSLPFPKNEFNVITVTFAVQWLHKQAFTEILRVLKPTGKVIFNVYPPVTEEADKYFDEVLKLDVSHQGAIIHKLMKDYVWFVEQEQD